MANLKFIFCQLDLQICHHPDFLNIHIQTHTTIIQSNKNTKINKTKKNKTIASGNFKDFLKAGMEGEVGAMIKGSS